MEIVTAASNWAKAEMASSLFFMLFGFVFMLMAIGIRYFGTTALAKTLFIPMLVAGALLLIAGISFYFSYKSKLTTFESDFNTDPSTMITSELEYTAKTIKTYENVAFKVFPAIVIIATVLAVFISNPLPRSICIAVIAFFSVLVLMDRQALKRIQNYHDQLELVAKDFEK